MRNKAKSTAAKRPDTEPSERRLHLVGESDAGSIQLDENFAAENLKADNLGGAENAAENNEGQVEHEAEEAPAHEIESSEDLVGIYLREMGVTPMLTREGEAALALRIERGCQRSAKAISRVPGCIEQVIAIGDRLKRGELHIREAVNFRDQEDITESGIEECLVSTLDS